MRQRIAIDMDEVTADTLDSYLAIYNADFQAQLSYADLAGQHIADAVPAAHRERVLAYPDDPAFFRALPVMADSQAVIQRLQKHYDVFIATAAMEYPTSFAAKFAWLRQHFPFIAPTNIVFCGDKSILDADYLIDDSARHFARFRGEGLLFSAPHNRDVTGYRRVASWQDVAVLLLPR
jgi:5'(3')-deoxyribonucleotidase